MNAKKKVTKKPAVETQPEPEESYKGALTRRDLVRRICFEFPMISADAFQIVDSVFDEIAKALSEGRSCEFRGFGVFSTKLHGARIGRNPRKPNATFNIPSHRVVRFRAGKNLRIALGETGDTADE